MPVRILLLLPVLPHLFLVPVLSSPSATTTRPGRRGHGRRRLGGGGGGCSCFGLAFTVDVDVRSGSIEGWSGRWGVVGGLAVLSCLLLLLGLCRFNEGFHEFIVGRLETKTTDEILRAVEE